MTWSMWQKYFPLTSANIVFEVNLDNSPPKLRMRQWRQIYKLERSPKTNGVIEADVRSVHMHSDQTRDLTVYNYVNSQSIIFNVNAYS